MEKPPLNQLEIDDLQDIGKYMFSVANGNHILRYSEKEYRNYLMQNPAAICQMFVIYHAASNWGYEDSRMFENYDEQWLASAIDIEFSSNLDFGLDDFSYEKLLPYQKAVIDFTYTIIPIIEDWSRWLKGGSLLERVYAIFANNLSLNTADGVVLNKEHAINRGIEMIRCILNDKYKPEVPFEKWELIIY